jgi:hypothetical protein
MFGLGDKLNDVVSQLRPDLSRESLGVGPAFPGVAPNPVLSRASHTRNAELRSGELAIGTLVDWREVSNEGSPRVVLMLDVDTPEGVSFRGIADETLTITELTRLRPGQRIPLRYRPAVMDHYVALARDLTPEQMQDLADRINPRTRD